MTPVRLKHPVHIEEPMNKGIFLTGRMNFKTSSQSTEIQRVKQSLADPSVSIALRLWSASMIYFVDETHAARWTGVARVHRQKMVRNDEFSVFGPLSVACQTILITRKGDGRQQVVALYSLYSHVFILSIRLFGLYQHLTFSPTFTSSERMLNIPDYAICLV